MATNDFYRPLDYVNAAPDSSMLFNPFQLRKNPVPPMTIPETPALPTAPTGVQTGFGNLNLSSILAALGTGLAPQRYDKAGRPIKSWQEGLGSALTEITRGQLMAKALGAPGGANTGTIDMATLLKIMGGGR